MWENAFHGEVKYVEQPEIYPILGLLNLKDLFSYRHSSGWKVYNSHVYYGKGSYIAATALKIGEVARLAGIPARTLRYYEEIGLISPSGRTDAGYRLYGNRELEQIEFVRRAKLMGLSLEQIRALTETVEQGAPGKVLRQLEEVLDQKLEETECKMQELRDFRESLLEYRERVSEAEAQDKCRCAQRGEGEYCDCVTATTDGVSMPELGVVQENERFVRSPVEAEACRCGCC